MTSGSNFDDRLQDWLEDGPTDAPHQVLDTVFAAVPSISQRRAGWRLPWMNSPVLGFARVLAGIAITVGLGSVLFLVLRPTPGGVGDQGSPSPAAVVPPSANASGDATASAPAPAPSAAAPCNNATLAARITMWEGAAGHRIAHVEFTNTGFEACVIQATLKPQLVDGNRLVLIDGALPAGSDPILTLAPGKTLKTLVQDGNYCGPAPVAPVSVAFVLADGSHVLAAPVSPTDATVPPCLGSGSKADIEMQPWAP
jgi:hypothetical protein